ncbi:MAG: 1-deoxy-D-xylulose-5-phosphate reductoisomerase [Spirochaetia bacterium]|nr:1-deoxy-D-xylulose-5-phosphate reductoisomerase [Spirochaetia bacterium]
MKSVVILGSTGSIGKSALDLFTNGPLKDCRVLALSANENAQELAAQVKKFRPKYAVIGNPEKAGVIKKASRSTKVLAGTEGLIKIAALKEADIILLAVVGAVGILPLLSAVRAGKKIAMANKEALVMAGSIVMKAAQKYGARIIPVDSEHSAIFQALQGNRPQDVKRLIITASGGPFKDMEPSQLKSITPAQALRHPTWKMGKKITIDSSTLMNKGLEVIEAHHLFGLPFEKIEVVIHPQSVIHSMVEYIDGSIIAQMSHPDMRLPILYALTYPERRQGVIKPMALYDIQKLEFFRVDFSRFPCFKLALKAGIAGGTMPARMNAANETAVRSFLNNRIKYNDIPYYVRRAMQKHVNVKNPDLQAILKADLAARADTEAMIDA